MDPDCCEDKQFFVESSAHHTEILLLCLRLMKRLKRNICNLDDHTVLSEVKDLSAYQKGHIGDTLEYACRFWTKHLLGIPHNSPCVKEVLEEIVQFSTTHLLHWIEVLALTRDLSGGVHAIDDVEQWYTSVSVVETIY